MGLYVAVCGYVSLDAANLIAVSKVNSLHGCDILCRNSKPVNLLTS